MVLRPKLKISVFFVVVRASLSFGLRPTSKISRIEGKLFRFGYLSFNRILVYCLAWRPFDRTRCPLSTHSYKWLLDILKNKADEGPDALTL